MRSAGDGVDWAWDSREPLDVAMSLARVGAVRLRLRMTWILQTDRPIREPCALMLAARNGARCILPII